MTPPPAACLPAGSFTANLFSTGGGVCNSNPFAKCFSSFTLATDVSGAGCGITLTPLAVSGVTVPALWTAASSGSAAVYVSCPTSALTGTGVADAAGTLEVLTAAKDVLNAAIWSTPVTELTSADLVQQGVFSFISSTCTLQYRITSGGFGSRPASKPNACDGIAGCETTASCVAGQYAVTVTALNSTCALCPPGEKLLRGKLFSPLPCSLWISSEQTVFPLISSSVQRRSPRPPPPPAPLAPPARPPPP